MQQISRICFRGGVTSPCCFSKTRLLIIPDERFTPPCLYINPGNCTTFCEAMLTVNIGVGVTKDSMVHVILLKVMTLIQVYMYMHHHRLLVQPQCSCTHNVMYMQRLQALVFLNPNWLTLTFCNASFCYYIVTCHFHGQFALILILLVSCFKCQTIACTYVVNMLRLYYINPKIN